MSKITAKVTWNKQDKKLQSLFGIDLMNMSASEPKFGPIRVPLSVWIPGRDEIKQTKGKRLEVTGSGISEKLLPPTLSNLAWHFGFLFWYSEAVLSMDRETNGKINSRTLDERFLASAKDKAVKLFEQEMVIPLRKALLELDHPLYFYCVPTKIYCINEITGDQEIKNGEHALQLLPATVESAYHYGFDEKEISLLAPTILKLIKNMCGWGSIRSPKKLEQSLDKWHLISDGQTFQAFQKSIESEHEHLIPTFNSTTLRITS